MGSYTVREIRETRPWSKDGGEATVIYYDFLVEGEERLVNVGRKPGNPLKVGDTLVGNLEPGGTRGGFKFVPERNGFGGGGGRGRDPKESAQIVQQHSQEMALLYARLQYDRGALPDNFNLEQLLVIAGKFASDAKAATP